MHLCCTSLSLSQNLVVAVSAEGWLHLFDLTSTKALDASGHHETLGEEQRPVFKQHIPANTKVMLISDIGEHEQQRGKVGSILYIVVCLLFLFLFGFTLFSFIVCLRHSY